MEELRSLLDQTLVLTKEYEQKNRDTAASFNVFFISHIEYDEVRVCRLITELIDPKGSHCQGDIYLRLFVEHVLGLSLGEEYYERVNVYREYRINNNRRIDIYIDFSGKIKIPIEVKINAEDQEAQCKDYLPYAQNGDLYYLTLDGHKPDESSIADLRSVTLISFSNEIINWLTAVLENSNTQNISSIKEVVSQFIITLKKITNKVDDKMGSQIKDLLCANANNMKNAELLISVVNKMNKEIRNEIFEEVDNKIREKHIDTFPLLENANHYTRINSWPGITYKIKPVEGNETFNYCLRVELDTDKGQFFVGVCVCDEEKIVVYNEVMGVNAKFILKNPNSPYAKWLKMEYVELSSKESPNFVNHNTAYYELFVNEKNKEEYIDAIINVVDFVVDDLV